jgi:hypothetical protein
VIAFLLGLAVEIVIVCLDGIDWSTALPASFACSPLAPINPRDAITDLADEQLTEVGARIIPTVGFRFPPPEQGTH